MIVCAPLTCGRVFLLGCVLLGLLAVSACTRYGFWHEADNGILPDTAARDMGHPDQSREMGLARDSSFDAGGASDTGANPDGSDFDSAAQDSSLDSGEVRPDGSAPDAGAPDATPDEGTPGLLRLSYTPVDACRIIDTRNRGGLFSEDESRGYLVYGASMSNQGGNAAGCPLPAGIGEPRAVHINVTALSDVGSGNFAVVRHGTPASIGLVNWNPSTGQPHIANAVSVEICPSDSACTRHIRAKLNHATSAGLVVDVLGYFTEDTAPDGYADKALVYSPVKPCRVVDTRSGGGGKFSVGENRNYFLYGGSTAISRQGGDSAGCPSPGGEPGAAHIRLTTVVTDPGSRGHVAAMPANGDPDAEQSFVNYMYGFQNAGNTGTIKTHYAGGSTSEDIKVSNRLGMTDIVIDVFGYYYPNRSSTSSPDGDYLFTPVTPCRLVDTRNTSNAFSHDEVQEYLVYGNTLSSQGGSGAGCPSPAGEPRAAHLNFTAIPVTGTGYLRAFAEDLASAPFASVVVNYMSGAQNISNATTIATQYNPTSTTEEIRVHNINGTEVDLAVAVFGYYYEKP